MLKIEDIINGIKSNWNLLLQGGIWIIALLSSFLLPTPLWDVKDNEGGINLFRFSQFAVAAIIGILIIPMRFWSLKKHMWYWWSIALGLMILSFSLFLIYNLYRSDWTVAYSNNRIVIGNTLLPDAVDYIQKIKATEERDISIEELVGDYAGDTLKIWPQKEIRQRVIKLVSLYLLTVFTLSLFIITLIQAIFCQNKTKRLRNV